MNAIGKAAAALAGVGGVAGGGILTHKLTSTNPDTIAHHIKSEHLLTNTHESQWTHRVNLLKNANEDNLVSELLPLKKKGEGLKVQDLQGWCSSSLKKEFKGTADKNFLNVKLYCGLNIGDKIAGTKVASGTDSGSAQLKANVDALKTKTEADLGKELFEITKKGNESTSWEGNAALKNWCLKTLDLAFEEGKIYDQASTYCVLK
ncbi:hypothetical protein HF1_09460 [Mycoplasma haemofelis str. Langford 1]|uniref:Uncharacterized protein n=1 Tax=Mycoplasma haemofelis (strain Langford 1) TaxID=941640 RepID=E8ZII3_MYCHL|nr:hypothetical protein [Mycoplasma haemofelis]CBY92954.1 hypothetical protein HF1_09460 [Mycoplasma haemofelis str. Langford 1]